MTKTELSALLGRPLSSVEDTNFDLYLSLAYDSLEELLCTTLTAASETRTFDIREGYSTAFIDIFRSVSAVTLDDDTVDSSDYSKRQWNKRNAEWYNSLVFDNAFTSSNEEIAVTAEWGFTTLPDDLQLVQAGLFDLISKRNAYNPTVESKRVEDFSIKFSTTTLDEGFYTQYRSIISKYSLCNIPNVQHGDCYDSI